MKFRQRTSDLVTGSQCTFFLKKIKGAQCCFRKFSLAVMDRVEYKWEGGGN